MPLCRVEWAKAVTLESTGQSSEDTSHRKVLEEPEKILNAWGAPYGVDLGQTRRSLGHVRPRKQTISQCETRLMHLIKILRPEQQHPVNRGQ